MDVRVDFGFRNLNANRLLLFYTITLTENRPEINTAGRKESYPAHSARLLYYSRIKLYRASAREQCLDNWEYVIFREDDLKVKNYPFYHDILLKLYLLSTL